MNNAVKCGMDTTKYMYEKYSSRTTSYIKMTLKWIRNDWKMTFNDWWWWPLMILESFWHHLDIIMACYSVWIYIYRNQMRKTRSRSTEWKRRRRAPRKCDISVVISRPDSRRCHSGYGWVYIRNDVGIWKGSLIHAGKSVHLELGPNKNITI